jgi:hypothetical protein
MNQWKAERAMSGMKNKLFDLNNHLFAQIERLANEDLTPENELLPV